MPGHLWARQAVAELEGMANVRVMTRTSVFGAFDHGVYGALERCSEHLAEAGGKRGHAQPRQVMWRIYAKRAILCAGASERGIAFSNNDRPGIMLASSVRAYANRWGVSPGRTVSVFTNNDDGWRTAHDLAALGVNIGVIADARDYASLIPPRGADVAMRARIVDTRGRLGLTSIELGDGSKIECDCLAVAGGWSPNVHLACHQRGRPQWRDDIAAFVPDAGDLPSGMTVAGAANGVMTLSGALRDGHDISALIAREIGHSPTAVERPPHASDEPFSAGTFWHVGEAKGRSWIDLQNDVTTKDIVQAHDEGFRSVEHLKRYTTLGMATDQGKTSNVLGLAILAGHSGRSIGEVGTTMFRPPFTPVPIGAFGGRERGKHFRPAGSRLRMRGRRSKGRCLLKRELGFVRNGIRGGGSVIGV